MSKKMISFEGTDELKEDLRIEAFKRSVSISALIRQLLEEGLNKERPSNEQNNQGWKNTNYSRIPK